MVDTKPGVYLPKTNEQWNLANDFFTHAVEETDCDLDNADVNSIICLMTNTKYNSFTENYGTVKYQVDQDLVTKYRECSVHSLKKALKRLKSITAPLNEIRYVSRQLRSKLNHNPDSSTSFVPDYDKYIAKNFCGFVKKIVDKPFRLLPSFSSEVCARYFAKLFSSVSLNRTFPIPSWLPSLPQPTIPFTCEPPSYERVTKVIRRVKASGIPCHLDQISVICFKR